MSRASDKEVGNRLLSYREKIDLSQSQMSESIGVSLRAYQNYERGERSITKEVICALFDKFGVDPTWLLTGVDTDKDGDGHDSPHYRGDVDITLLDGIEIAFEDYRHNHQIYGIDCYAHDLGLIYNRVIKSIKPGENWTKIVKQEVRYLMEIRRSDKLRDNTSTTPLVVHEEEQRLLKKHGMTVKDAYGEECVNPIEGSKNVVTQTIEGNNHQISGRDLINKGKK